MLETSARLLALLGLMQARAQWSGAELADRLDVGERTVRKDMERLRELGYPIDADRGPAGGYRLGDNGRLPPLLLDDDEAVAIAVGLGAVTGVRGIEEASTLALTKLEHVLPARLRRRVSALHESTSTGPANTGSNVADPVVDAGLLTDLAAAIRDHEAIRFSYLAPSTAEEVVAAEPYRLVNWQHRWYVVARVRGSNGSGAAPRSGSPGGRLSLPWRVFRLDWMTLRVPGGGRFDPDPLVGEDYTGFVLREVAFSGWAVHTRIVVDAPASDVLARINPTVGVVETVDEQHCVLVTGGDSLEIIAVWIGMLGLDFHVSEPRELVDHVQSLAERYRRALPHGG
jgi:predicted DNA-binding transcriptional regulator YafY